MPTTQPVNIQQILQMGTHTEKLQATLQDLPQTTAQQLDAERAANDELKRSEVQDMEFSEAVNPTGPENRHRRRIRVFKKPSEQEEEEAEGLSEKEISRAEKHQGTAVDLVV